MMKSMYGLIALGVVVFSFGCATAPRSDADKAALMDKAAATIARFKQTDPSMSKFFFDKAVGYAVFPTVGKGGVGVGGAYGRGALYQGGSAVGYCDLSQGSVGFQLGGQAYSEIIFFETKDALEKFKRGEMEFSAQASAVAASADASSNADYDHGVAVFTLAGEGLMYEASIGGQKFSYQPK